MTTATATSTTSTAGTSATTTTGPRPDEDCHGTHVAGTIAASLNGQASSASRRASGSWPSSSSATSDCGSTEAMAAPSTTPRRSGSRSSTPRGARRARRGLPELYDAIATSGMLFVAAAGQRGDNNDNGASPEPARLLRPANILSVAAIDQGGLAAFSNYGARRSTSPLPASILSALPADPTYPAGLGLSTARRWPRRTSAVSRR